MSIVKKGQWYSLCCHEDLCEADEDEEIDDDFSVQIFATREEGLKAIANDWERSGYPEQAKECLDMLNDGK